MQRGWRPRPRNLIIGSILAVVALTLVPPIGSTDMLDYAVYGRIAGLGHSPYRMTPAELAVMPATRLDWIALGRSVVGGVAELPGVTFYTLLRPHWLAQADDAVARDLAPLALLAITVALIWLCMTRRWLSGLSAAPPPPKRAARRPKPPGRRPDDLRKLGQ